MELACFASIGAKSPTYSEPVNSVGVGGEASATGVLLITSTVDNDGVLEGSYKKCPLALEAMVMLVLTACGDCVRRK